MKHPTRLSPVLLAFVGILGGFLLSPGEAQAQSPTAQRPAGKPSTKVQHDKTSPALLQGEEGIITTTAKRIPLSVRPDVFGTAEATSTQTAQRLPSAQNSRTKTSAEAVSTMLRKSDIQEIGYNANGTLRFAEGRFGSLRSRVSKNVEMSTPYTLVANAEMRSQDAETRAAKQAPIIRETFALLKERSILRGLERPDEELSLMSLTSDRLGFQHIRFEQTYRGLRVHGRDVYVHADAKGDVYSVHGLYEPTPTQEHSAIPTLTQESAFIATRNALAENGLWKSMSLSVLELFGAERAWKGELLWYPVTETENPRLAKA